MGGTTPRHHLPSVEQEVREKKNDRVGRNETQQIMVMVPSGVDRGEA